MNQPKKPASRAKKAGTKRPAKKHQPPASGPLGEETSGPSHLQISDLRFREEFLPFERVTLVSGQVHEFKHQALVLTKIIRLLLEDEISEHLQVEVIKVGRNDVVNGEGKHGVPGRLFAYSAPKELQDGVLKDLETILPGCFGVLAIRNVGPMKIAFAPTALVKVAW